MKRVQIKITLKDIEKKYTPPFLIFQALLHIFKWNVNFNISDFVDVWSFVSFCVYIQDKLIDEIILLQVIVTESYVDINLLLSVLQ